MNALEKSGLSLDRDRFYAVPAEILTTILYEFFSDTDVYTQTDPVATNHVNDYLKGTCTCDEGVDVDDLLQMEQRLEAAVKDERFFESITRNLKEKLEKHLRQAQSTVKMRTRKLLVNHVLSWNNEKNCVIMLKHSFHHRKSEYMVNFKVSDLIAGNRTLFGKPGKTFYYNYVMLCIFLVNILNIFSVHRSFI